MAKVGPRAALVCPYCENDDPTQITIWLEPRSNLSEEAAAQEQAGRKYYCEQCGRTWTMRPLPGAA